MLMLYVVCFMWLWGIFNRVVFCLKDTGVNLTVGVKISLEKLYM
jgi:hypothetical protein